MVYWSDSKLKKKENNYGLLFQRFCCKEMQKYSLIARADSVIDVVLFIARYINYSLLISKIAK